jgi:hypothetical protein
VGGALFAQEKLGLTVTTEVDFGDVANSDLAKPFTSGAPADVADFIAGSAIWTIPKFEFSRTAGKWSFAAMGKLTVSSSKTVNAPVYGRGDGSVKLTYLIADGVNVWGQIGDGVELKPGFSYAAGPVTAQLEIPFVSGLFTNPVIKLEPKVSYSASGIGASLKAVFALADVTEPDELISDDDDWDSYKQRGDFYPSTSFVQGLELNASYATGPVKIEATFYFPLYANWALDPDNFDDLGIISGDAVLTALMDMKSGKGPASPPAISGKGITIEPKVTYTIGAVALYAQVKIGNIGLNADLIDLYDDFFDKKLGVSVAPKIGVSYSF